jgi:signal transduction histidine kinase
LVVALGLVTLLMTGMIGLDLFFARRVCRDTEDILENSVRSIVLLQDIRVHVTRLLAADLREHDIGSVTEAIAADGRDYDQLATYPGEREEWANLQGILRRLITSLPGTPRSRTERAREIYDSINHLVSINLDGSRTNIASIRAVDRQAVVSDALVGGAALGLVMLIGAWLLRVLGRQRRMVEERVHLLDEKNNELEAFAGRAAHDLRSPMNPIRGYTDLILEAKGLPEGVPAMAQRIRRAVDRMAHVVDDMLALSISGRPPPGQSATTVVVTRMLEEMGADLNGVDVVTKLDDGRVACTEGVLSQILRNLVGNAIKFRARHRPLRITIETRDVGSMVEIAIEDNGVGMESESAKHAFEPFYRGQMDRELPGHGLGLSIVERTTRALGGYCDLTSVLDHSTRIVVRLSRA